MSDETPEQQLGALAARALDGLDGRPIVGAVLLLVVDNGDDMSSAAWFVPQAQPWQLTVGMVEDWRIAQQALITASAVRHAAEDDEDDG